MRTDDLVPPDHLISSNAGGLTPEQFVANGDLVVERTFVADMRLPRSARVLDLGCGCGRVARPLTRYLSSDGRYDGVDVGREAIEWCRAAYAAFPNFHFHYADLRNTCYNPAGAGEASDYVLPFPADAFDLVYLGSVFTHMLPEQVAQYLREIARVLKPTGTCLATFFLLDDQSRPNNAAGRTAPSFGHEIAAGCRVENSALPEAAVAYEEELARRFYADAGLAVTAIRHGEWGRERMIPKMLDHVWARRA